MSKLQFILKRVFVVAIILFVASLTVYHLIPCPGKTTRQFFLHLKYERYEEAYGLTDGIYRENRGPFERFRREYYDAVRSGTRTRRVFINGIQRTDQPDHYIVHVTVRVLYRGDLLDTQGSYLLRNVSGKGWRIVQNVSNIVQRP